MLQQNIQQCANKIDLMSVKYQRRTRQNSSLHQSREWAITPISHPQDSTYHTDYIICHKNRVQFHKKLIETFSLHLICNSVKNSQMNQSQAKENLVSCEDGQNGVGFQIVGTSLNVNKAHVKHSFSVLSYIGDNMEFLRFQTALDDSIVIKSCNFNAKNGLKLHIVSDQSKIGSKHQNTCVIRPFQLLEQNMRLRAQKLNRSASKTLKFSTQCQKKININWNRESVQSPTEWRPKRQVIKAAVFNIDDSACRIRDVEYKKSVDKDKYQRNKSRSFSKPDRISSLKNVLHSKNMQKQNVRNKMISSKSYKNMNASYAEGAGDTALRNKKQNIGEEQEQLSSQSYYTAKKDIEKDIQIPTKLQHKKVTQTSSKQNQIVSTSSTKKINNKWGYSQFRHTKQVQINTMINSTLDPKRFNKNISQAKIAQISRTLMTQKNKK